MAWQLEPITDLNGYTVEWAEPGNYYLSRLNRIYHSTDLARPFQEVGRIDAPSWRSLTSRSRLGQRLLRFMVYNLIQLPNDDLFVTFDKSIGLIRNGKYVPIKGLVRPYRVLRSGCAVDNAGNVYFGEYLANPGRGVVRIYRYRPGDKHLMIVHTFTPGSIRHIHGLYFDPFSDHIYCLTGDGESECQIIRTADGFTSTETVGAGDESWRAVSLLFDEDQIYYGTDAEYCRNQIFSIDRNSCKRSQIGEVSGTVFYSKRLATDLFFTTTAENAPGQTENVAALWNVDAGGKLNRIAVFEKDRWHGNLFMFGTIHLPFVNRFEDRLYFSLIAVDGDNKAFCLRRL